MFYSTAPPACSILTICDQWRKCVNRTNCIFQCITGSHYSRSTSHSTVLRGSCLLVILLYFYMSISQRSVCDCNKGILYCIVIIFVVVSIKHYAPRVLSVCLPARTKLENKKKHRKKTKRLPGRELCQFSAKRM